MTGIVAIRRALIEIDVRARIDAENAWLSAAEILPEDNPWSIALFAQRQIDAREQPWPVANLLADDFLRFTGELFPRHHGRMIRLCGLPLIEESFVFVPGDPLEVLWREDERLGAFSMGLDDVITAATIQLQGLGQARGLLAV
jgi:hypothetical protein